MSQNNKKIKFNIIDCIILIAVIICICAAAVFFYNKDGLFTKFSYNIEYEITVNELSDDLTDNISKGDTVCSSYTSFPIGTVTDVRVEKISYVDAYGRTSESANSSKLVIRVRTGAEKHNGIFTVNGVEISKGSYIKFRVPELEAYGLCTFINQY